MYNKKFRWFFVIGIVILFAGIFTVQQGIVQPGGAPETIYSYDDMLNSVTLGVKKGDFDLMLGRSQAGWIDGDNKKLIGGNSVTAMVGEIADAEILAVLAEENEDIYGFAGEERIEITLLNANDEPRADFIVGKEGDVEGSFFLKDKISNKTYLVSANKEIFDLRVANIVSDPSEL